MDGYGKHSAMDLIIMDELQREKDRRNGRLFSVDGDDDDQKNFDE